MKFFFAFVENLRLFQFTASGILWLFQAFTHPLTHLFAAHAGLSVGIIDMLILFPAILLVSRYGEYSWRKERRFFNLQDHGIHYYDCNIRPTSINSKERNLDGKETRNLSKIWPLDLDFPADFLKYWQSLEFLQSLELLCSGGSCGGFLNSKKCSVGLWGASFSGVT